MKGTLLFLVVILTLHTLAACSSIEDISFSDASSESLQTYEEIPLANLKIEEGTLFGSQTALVRLQGEKELSVIDTSGNILFKLAGNLYLSSSFSHDIAIVSQSSGDVLCHKDGSVYSPADFGCTDFFHTPFISQQALLDDGIILIENENDKTAGALGSNLQWQIPLSKEFYNMLNHLDDCKVYACGYYVGSNDREELYYINFYTGKIGTDLTEIEATEPSDFYYLAEDGQILDLRTGKAIARLNNIGLLANGGQDSYFRNRQLFVQDFSDKEGNPGVDLIRYYVIDPEGNYVIPPRLRKPLLTGAFDNTVVFCNETMLVASTEEVTKYEKDGQTTIALRETSWSSYGTDGKLLGSFAVPDPDIKKETTYLAHTDISIKNEIVKLEYCYVTVEPNYIHEERHVLYLNRELEPLF